VLSVATQQSSKDSNDECSQKPNGTASWRSIASVSPSRTRSIKRDHVLVDGQLVRSKYERENGKVQEGEGCEGHHLLECASEFRPQAQPRGSGGACHDRQSGARAG